MHHKVEIGLHVFHVLNINSGLVQASSKQERPHPPENVSLPRPAAMAESKPDIATSTAGYGRQVSPEVEEGYTIIRDLGSGKFGQVKEVQQKDSKKHFAWKSVRKETDPYCEIEVGVGKENLHCFAVLID